MPKIMDLPTMLQEFVTRTNLPIMAVQTNGTGSSSTRYSNELSLPEKAINNLIENDLVFLTFESDYHTKEAFRDLCDNFPPSNETTLSLFVHICIPGGKGASFEATQGIGRVLHQSGLFDRSELTAF